MKRHIFALFVSLLLLTPALASASEKQDARSPGRTMPPAEKGPVLVADASSGQSELYSKAKTLFESKKYDETIQLLSGPASADRYDFKLNILLAKAQLEKCAILKANGDGSYKQLIEQPYSIGRRLYKLDKTNPEPYYIVARSLLINERLGRAGKTIKKALYFSPNNPDYLLVLGDVWSALLGRYKSFSKAEDAYKRAMSLRKNDHEFKVLIEKRLEDLSKREKALEESGKWNTKS